MLNRLVGLIFGLLLISIALGQRRTHYQPIVVDFDKTVNFVDYNCSYGEGNNHPNNELGLTLLRIAQQKYEQGFTDNSGAFPEITQQQIEGFVHPTSAPINKYYQHPRNFPLAVGVAGDIFSESAYLFGGTSDPNAYEKLFGGYPLNNVFPEIYSFILCKCSWELRGITKSGLAFATAQQYSFPECDDLKRTYCDGVKKHLAHQHNHTCPEYPMPTFCSTEGIVLFGGTNGTHYSNKVIFYNPSNGAYFSVPALYDSTVLPEDVRLAGHASFIAGRSLYVIGGLRQVAGLRAPVFSDTIYKFNLDTLTWTLVRPSTNRIPRISFHTAVHYGSFNPIRFILNGGITEDGTLNPDTYQVEISPSADTYTVTKVSNPSVVRPASFGHSAQVNKDNIFYYGGAVLNQYVASLPIATDNPQVTDHNYSPFTELWRYNIPTNTWVNLTQIHPYLGSTVGPVMLEYNDELLIFGGIGSEFRVQTGVFRISVNNPTYVTRPCCSPGYEGLKCDNPICTSNCGGPLIGKCVGPDTCECYNGFTGDNCEQHVCSTRFNEDLISLNDALFYPKASANILNKIDQILSRLRFLRSNLRPWRANSLVTKYKDIAQSMYQFNTLTLDKFFNDLQEEVTSFVNLNT